jgi:hypothetical protein
LNIFLKGFYDEHDIKKYAKTIWEEMMTKKLHNQSIESSALSLTAGYRDESKKASLLKQYLHAVEIMKSEGYAPSFSPSFDGDKSYYVLEYTNGLKIKLMKVDQQVSADLEAAKKIDEVVYCLTFIYKEPKEDIAATELTQTLKDGDGPNYFNDNEDTDAPKYEYLSEDELKPALKRKLV